MKINRSSSSFFLIRFARPCPGLQGRESGTHSGSRGWTGLVQPGWDRPYRSSAIESSQFQVGGRQFDRREVSHSDNYLGNGVGLDWDFGGQPRK
ncbi:unnamed protein product [Calypogeia fissa]